MEARFRNRFKSSLKINKNSSIFDKLIPIDKVINKSQIHDDIPITKKLAKIMRSHKFTTSSDYKPKHKLQLPLLMSPTSTNSYSTAKQKSRLKLNKSTTPQLENSILQISPIKLSFKLKTSRESPLLHSIGLDSLSQTPMKTPTLSKKSSYGQKRLLKSIDRISYSLNI